MPQRQPSCPSPPPSPASWISWPSLMAVSGVCSAVLRTMVLPAARAGPNFQAAINRGKFHGMILGGARCQSTVRRSIKHTPNWLDESHSVVAVDVNAAAATHLPHHAQWLVQGVGPVGAVDWYGLALDLVRPPDSGGQVESTSRTG